jgi:flagellar basal-body M-ring protein/flagellar hook-basal body protein fliF
VQEKLNLIKENISAMSFNQKALSGVALAVSLAVSGFAVTKLNEPSYVTMMTELDQPSLQAIIPVLEAEQIPFMVSPNKKTLLVDQASLQQASVVLAKNGLPSKPVSGYDHLNNSSSPYVTKTTEEQVSRQILEENLVSSILKIEVVEDAQVRLALAKNSQFLRDVDPASASVVLTLKRGMSLNRGQVDGIVKLISFSVPNLPPENVIVLDHTGRALSKGGESSIGSGSAIADHKLLTEQQLKQKVIEVVAPVVGLDNLRVNVEAELNFDKVEQTTEAPVTDSVILSQQVEKSYDPELAGGGGVVGAVSNQPPSHSSFKESPDSSKSSQKDAGVSHVKETTNYSVGKSITHTIKTVGEVKNVHVAILFDSSKFAEDELQAIKSTIESLTQSSIGFDQARGDVINIESMVFATPETPEVKEPAFYETKIFADGLEAGKWLGGLFLLWLMFWRPLLNRLGATAKPEKEEEETLATSDVVEGELPTTDQLTEQAPSLTEITEQMFNAELEQTKQLLSEKADASMNVVQSWLKDQSFDEFFQEQTEEEPVDIVDSEDEYEEENQNEK